MDRCFHIKNRPAPYFLFALIILLATSCSTGFDTVCMVDPLIGTGETHFASLWRSEGSTYPGAVAPHGMIQISSETSSKADWLKGYYHWHDTIRFFSMAEHFSGWPDGSAGKGRFMPFNFTGDLQDISPDDHHSSFNHEEEIAQPGYYSVLLRDHGISCEYSALTRSAMGRISYSDPQNKGIIFLGEDPPEKVTDSAILLCFPAGRGEMGKAAYCLYLYVEFDAPFRMIHQGEFSILLFPDQDTSLSFRYAGSYTSAENAILNLDHEMNHWNLDVVRRKSRILWKRELSCVELRSKQKDDMTVFYTALYHASLLPLIASDVNGQYPGFEGNQLLEKGEDHYMYFSPWDAFRTYHPLISFLKPVRSRDMLRSMLRYYRDVGILPEPRVMTGIHCSAIFADALARGIRDFDVSLAYQALCEMMLEEPLFRPSMKLYDSLGYVPYPFHYATTATLEFAYNDWCLGRIALETGDNVRHRELTERSLSYRNNFRVEDKFMRTRNKNGSWAEVSLYAEADPWNASWFVPHNTADLVQLMGGSAAFVQHLDRNFEEGHFVLDNECPMNFPFLYAWSDQTWKSQLRARQALREHFNSSPGGIPGNDDYGSMSSWLVWTCMGFFPACPGTDELIICGPVFDKVIIRREGEKPLKIKAVNAPDKNCFIRSMRIQGAEYNRSWISSSDMFLAGRIHFLMDSLPNKNWGKGPAPYAVNHEFPFLAKYNPDTTWSKIRQDLPAAIMVPLDQEAQMQNSSSSTGSVLHYTFEEDGSRVFDHSGHQNHGKLMGDVERLKGKAGIGIRIHGGYVHIPRSETLDIQGDELTLMCWFKPMKENGQAALITRGGHDQLKLNGPWQVRFNAGSWGKGMCVYTVGPKPDQADVPLWDQQWMHFTGVLGNDSIHLYVNGKLRQSQRHRGGTGPTEMTWRLGSNVESPLGRAPEGIIDEVMIFDRALSQAEINELIRDITP